MTTSLFGDAPWAVRLASPILHACTGLVIFLTGRTAFNAQTGFWACAIYLLMPALWLSSSIISTDVPLLLCWALALHAWINLRKAELSKSQILYFTVQMGLAIGMGTLAKYAMLFFLPALIMAILIDKPTRAALLTPYGLVILGLAAFMIAPNIAWNLQNNFATLSHTASNANMSDGPSFYPAELFRFLGDQLGVFGPISFVILGLALGSAFRKKIAPIAVSLSVFTLTPLLIISLQALASRANANWAVTAYIAASLLTAHFCVRFWPKLKLWLIGSLTVQTILCLGLAVILISPALTNRFDPLANSVKHLRAWPETVSILQKIVDDGIDGQAYRYIAVDNRMTFYSLNYYGLTNDKPDGYNSTQDYSLKTRKYPNIPFKMWMYKTMPHNQAELTAALPAGNGPILLINYHKNYEPEFREDFNRLIPLPPLDIDLGGGKRRTYKLWAAYGYTPTQTRN